GSLSQAFFVSAPAMGTRNVHPGAEQACSLLRRSRMQGVWCDNKEEAIPATRGRFQTRLLLTLIAVPLAVFAAVCGHEFVDYDDTVNIYSNPHVQGLTWEHLRWMFTDTSYARRYMPLGWLSYALDYQLFGLNPQAFHVGNLLLHLINTVVLYFLLKHLLLVAGKPAHPEPANAAPIWCAAVGALFWAVNP